MVDTSNYEKARENASNFYKKEKKIYCPAIKSLVHFTSEGFNHMIYKNDRSERDRKVQITRFNLLPVAKELIKKTTTYQEYEEFLQEIDKKIKKKRIKATVQCKKWKFIAIIRKTRIRVVVIKYGNSDIKFLTVIPAWNTKYYNGIKLIEHSKGIDDE